MRISDWSSDVCSSDLDAEIIREVLAAPHEKDTVTLCVDRNLDNPLNDPDDVTRVRCVGDRIERVGKVLRDNNAFDTGDFYCYKVMFDALVESFGRGDDSISGAIWEIGRAHVCNTVTNAKFVCCILLEQ